MIKVGLEKEVFLTKYGEVQVVPEDIPSDECGLLAEARGKPSSDVVEAVYSLKAEMFKLCELVEEYDTDMTVSDFPLMKISRDLRLRVSRLYSKGLTKYENLYGFTRHSNKINEQTAGVHISFTNEYEFIDKENKVHIFNLNFDWVKIFKRLDEEFKEEIKNAKRKPGFYEIKADGRIEYRSLPSNVTLEKVIIVLREMLGR